MTEICFKIIQEWVAEEDSRINVIRLAINQSLMTLGDEYWISHDTIFSTFVYV